MSKDEFQSVENTMRAKYTREELGAGVRGKHFFPGMTICFRYVNDENYQDNESDKYEQKK
jgi:hypothetical protein